MPNDLCPSPHALARAPAITPTHVLALAAGGGPPIHRLAATDAFAPRPLPFAQADRRVRVQHVKVDNRQRHLSLPRYDRIGGAGTTAFRGARTRPARPGGGAAHSTHADSGYRHVSD